MPEPVQDPPPPPPPPLDGVVDATGWVGLGLCSTGEGFEPAVDELDSTGEGFEPAVDELDSTGAAGALEVGRPGW